MVVERFHIVLVRLDPATGAETAKTRIVKRLGRLNSETAHDVLDVLGELFAP